MTYAIPKHLTHHQKARVAMANTVYNRLTEKDEDVWISRMRGYLDRQKEPLLRAISELQTIAVAEMLPDETIRQGNLFDIYRALYIEQGQKYYEYTRDELEGEKTTLNFIQTKQIPENDPYYQQMINLVGQLTATNIVSIVETSRGAAKKAIRAIVEQAIQEGWGIPETKRALEKAIRKTWRDMKTFRPFRIARTEVATIVNNANFYAAQNSRTRPDKVWLARLDGRERDSHRMADGQQREIDEPFNVGGYSMMHPHDTGAPAEEVVNCFPGNQLTYVDPKTIKKAYRSLYKGDVITIQTSTGNKFTCTPNHPILTTDGWVAAQFITDSHNLVKSSSVESIFSEFNVNDIPSTFKEVYDSLSVVGVVMRMDVGVVNFYGDVPSSDVDIVSVPRQLRRTSESSILKKINSLKFFGSHLRKGFHFRYGLFSSGLIVKRFRQFSHRFIRLFSDSFQLFWGAVIEPNNIRLRSVSNRDVESLEYAGDDISGKGKGFTQRKAALPLFVPPTNFLMRMFCVPRRLGVTTFPDNRADCKVVSSESPADVMHRNSRFVKFDNVVSVDVTHDFNDYVYTFETDTQMYDINQYVARNCRCRLIYVTRRR